MSFSSLPFGATLMPFVKFTRRLPFFLCVKKKKILRSIFLRRGSGDSDEVTAQEVAAVSLLATAVTTILVQVKLSRLQQQEQERQQHFRSQKYGIFISTRGGCGAVLAGVVMMLAVKMAMMMAADMIM